MVVHSRLRANSSLVESLDQTNEMERGLSNRHVQFIAIGGTIGTGLFLGSGKSISLTGPSIIFVYILVGVIMFFLMRAIGEMMYRDPSQHTFINFITRYLGNGWGQFAGWTYSGRARAAGHDRDHGRLHVLHHLLRHVRHRPDPLEMADRAVFPRCRWSPST